MPINVYDLLIRPVGETLQSDPRFQELKIFYDRSRERAVPRDNMPAINYFLEAPWEEITRGSGAYTLQTKTMTVRLGFAVWIFDARDPARLDQALFQVSGDLFDFFRDHVDFDTVNGVFVNNRVPITFDVDYTGDEGGLVGSQKLTVTFDMMSGTGR